MTLLGIAVGPDHRVVDEDAIIELLLVKGWPTEVAGGDRAQAEPHAREALQRLVSQGLGFERSATGERLFDPAELINLSLVLSLDHNDPLWPDHCIPAGLRRIWAAHGLAPRPGGCPPPDRLGPRRFIVRMRRLFNLAGREPGTPARLRLPLPIEDEALGDLTLTILPSAEVEADFTVAEARLDARLIVPANRSVELGFEVEFTARPQAGDHSSAGLDPDAFELYTRPREGLVRVTQAIRRLADDVAGTEPDPWSQVGLFWTFMRDNLRLGVVRYDEVDMVQPNDWTLTNRWSDCQFAAALLVALCRARGIAARMIGGYVLDENIPYYHCWAEVWVPGGGWRPVDTECWYYALGDQAPFWVDYYLGRMDHRMKTECLPRLFNGPGSIRLPDRWHRLLKLEGGGLSSALHNSETGALVYRDHVAIVGGDGPPALRPA